MSTKFELSPEATRLNAKAIAEINSEVTTPKPMTTREKRKTASKTLRAYFEFMRIDASAKDIIGFMHKSAFRGVDWTGATKSSLASSWAVHAVTESEEHGITVPPFERLKAEFGLKSKY